MLIRKPNTILTQDDLHIFNTEYMMRKMHGPDLAKAAIQRLSYLTLTNQYCFDIYLVCQSDDDDHCINWLYIDLFVTITAINKLGFCVL